MPSCSVRVSLLEVASHSAFVSVVVGVMCEQFGDDQADVKISMRSDELLTVPSMVGTFQDQCVTVDRISAALEENDEHT